METETVPLLQVKRYEQNRKGLGDQSETTRLLKTGVYERYGEDLVYTPRLTKKGFTCLRSIFLSICTSSELEESFRLIFTSSYPETTFFP